MHTYDIFQIHTQLYWIFSFNFFFLSKSFLTIITNNPIALQIFLLLTTYDNADQLPFLPALHRALQYHLTSSDPMGTLIFLQSLFAS